MRIVVATIVGTVVYFIWGMVAWMLLPLHTPTLNKVSEENELQSFVSEQDLDAGYYIVPWMPDPTDPDATEEWTEKHKQGPVMSLIVADGSTPMPPSMMIRAVVMDFVAALMVAFVLCSATCCEAYLKRVGLVVAMGIFAAVVSHVALWNWMYYPLDYTIAMCVDVVVGWGLTGLVMAAMIKRNGDVTLGS